MRVELRPCGLQGWAVCGGNCEKCGTTATTYTPYDPIEIARQYAPKFDKPVVDMVEVVRCRDCKWIDLCKDPEHYEYKGANGFCSKGERRGAVEEWRIK